MNILKHRVQYWLGEQWGTYLVFCDCFEIENDIIRRDKTIYAGDDIQDVIADSNFRKSSEVTDFMNQQQEV